MNDNDLHQELRRAGMEWFAEYYRDLSNWSLSNHELIEKMIAEKGYTTNSSQTKVSSGRRIIKSGRGKDALNLITGSKNERAVALAQALLRRGIEN